MPSQPSGGRRTASKHSIARSRGRSPDGKARSPPNSRMTRSPTTHGPVAYPEMGAQRVHRSLTTVPLLALQNAVSRGDQRWRERGALAVGADAKRDTGPYPRRLGNQLARIALAQADTTLAVRWLDQNSDVPSISTLPYVPTPPGLVRRWRCVPSRGCATRSRTLLARAPRRFWNSRSGADAPLRRSTRACMRFNDRLGNR
jgi:hypothetical protein